MNILVTGAGKGIGFELCRIFLSEGHIVLAISRDVKQLIALNHPNLRALSFDITRFNDTQLFLEKVKAYFDHIDILVNNAGVLINKPFIDTDINEWHEMINSNLLGHAFVIRSLLSLMGGEQYSSIINIGSMSGYQGSLKYPGLVAYGSIKGALSIFSETLAVELESNNISCNCLCLGSADTEMFSEAFPGQTASLSAFEMAAWVRKEINNSYGKLNGKVIPLSVRNP